MRPVFIKFAPAVIALVAAVAVAACSKDGEHVTATGDELSAEFSAQAISTTPKSYESALPGVDLPTVDANSATAS